MVLDPLGRVLKVHDRLLQIKKAGHGVLAPMTGFAIAQRFERGRARMNDSSIIVDGDLPDAVQNAAL